MSSAKPPQGFDDPGSPGTERRQRLQERGLFERPSETEAPLRPEVWWRRTTGQPGLVPAGVHSPLLFPRSIGTLEAQRRSAVDGRPVVFWRPGCKYCIRLRIRLVRSARHLHSVNI